MRDGVRLNFEAHNSVALEVIRLVVLHQKAQVIIYHPLPILDRPNWKAVSRSPDKR